MGGVIRRAIAAMITVSLLGVACSRSETTSSRTESNRPGNPAPKALSYPPVSTPPEGVAAKSGPVFMVRRIDAEMKRRLVGRDWHPGCPVPIAQLRELTVSYWGFDGQVKRGPLVVNAQVAGEVLWVFRRLFRARFPIEHIELAPKYHPTRPSDYWSTKDETSAFNCRPVTDGTAMSQHSYGWAVDINPLQNPYVRSNGSVLRRAAKPYLDRSKQLPGMIHAGDVVVGSFTRIGWGWGGDWKTIKDYMHFSLTGK